MSIKEKEATIKKYINDGTPWEESVGYSRAIRVGQFIEIAGTTSVLDGKIVGLNDPYQQTKFILQKIEKTLNKLSASLENVVRTRIYVTDISKWKDIGKAHSEVFKSIKPVTTMVEVKSLIDPDLLVEIEVTAIEA